MARYILDTNIILGYLRASKYAEYVDSRYSPLTPPNIAAISVVTLGELISLSYKRKWGTAKKKSLEELVRKLPQIDIHTDSIISLYGEIDAFSQGYHPDKRLIVSARNMGKNDLWIAATTAAANATLITTDGDFDHLDGIFFPVIKVDPKIK